MSRILLFILIVIVAIGIGIFISLDTGDVSVSYQDWTLETPLWLAILAVLTLFLMINLIARLIYYVFHIPRYFQYWRNNLTESRAHNARQEGLLSLAAGNLAQAEQAFQKAQTLQPEEITSYFGAATAQHYAQLYQSRDDTLQALLDQLPSKHHLPIEILRAQWQVDANQMAYAAPTLRRLATFSHKYPMLSGLLTTVYLVQEDWEMLLAQMKYLPNTTAEEQAQQRELCHLAYCGLLADSSKDSAQLAQAWQYLPRHARKDASLMHVYITYLCSLQAEDTAEKILRQYLSKQWDSALIELYGTIATHNPQQQLNWADKQLPSHPNDASLWFTLARLAQRCELWGQTRRYFERCRQETHSPSVCQEYADFLAEQGDVQLAIQEYQTALGTSTSMD